VTQLKKEVITIPWEKCPLDVLAEMGKETEKAWIFLNTVAVRNLELSSDSITLDDYETLKWSQTSEHPATSISFERNGKVWSKVHEIDASDIEFKHEPFDPENLFFIKME
jgi:hypothetical protein